VSVHGRALDELELCETQARERLFDGLLMGGGAGALFGGALSAMGLMVTGVTASAIFGGAVGMVLGALGGVLTGLASPDHTLERLSHAGKVVLTIDAPGLTVEEHAEDVVRRHGGRIEHKPIL
jgi:hypothetical protein